MDNTKPDLTDVVAFNALREKVLAPFARSDGADTTPKVAVPTKIEGVWTDFDPQIISRWAMTVDAGGGVTLRDGVTPTPGWSLGDSVVVAKYFKIGQLVRIKVVVTHGTNKLYGLANTAAVAGSPQAIGELGTTSMVLPFPPSSAGRAGYGMGLQAATATTINSGGVTTRRPLFYTGAGIIFGSGLSPTPSFFNTLGYNGRVVLGFMDAGGASWNPGPAVYYASAPGFNYALPGETFVFFLKYHANA